jgi:UDP-N-acetylglucosamine 3-dehydrogenase
MTVRIAVLGCGAIARRAHLPALRLAGAEIVVLASRSLASAQAAADECGAGEVSDDWRAAVTRGDIDAVDICTPNRLHVDMAVAAADAGKNVLVEKPLACTVEEADRMMAAADRAGVLLMPAHNLRFAPPLVAMREAVASGRIGRPLAVRSAFGHGGPEGWAPEATWFRDRDQAGGGALLDLGVHMADLLRAVLADDVVEVSAALQGGAPGVEDAGTALLRFAGGATGTLHASWVARPGPDLQLTVSGTEGILHLDGRTPPTVFPGDGGEAERVPVAAESDNPYAAFVRAVETGEGPPVTADDGRAAVAIISAAYRSASTGRRERVA